jgi:hypothetical protein
MRVFLARLGCRPLGAALHQLESLGERQRPGAAGDLKNGTFRTAGIIDALLLPDIGVMSHILSAVTG